MKKSKKILLWSIVPILGVSSGAACAIAGVTNQNSSTNTNNLVSLNSATPLARSINETESKLKIVDQTYDVLVHTDSDLSEILKVELNNTTDKFNLRYDWWVNKNNNWELYVSNTQNWISVDVPDEVTSMQNWTFRCIVTDIKSGDKVTSEDIKFTITPWEGEYVELIQSLTSKQTILGGQKITLDATAEATSLFEKDEIGYRWFEYDSENNAFTLIEGANGSKYTFVAPYSETTQTKKYVCKYYFKSNTGIYISESNQAIITINKSESTEATKTLKVDSSVENNQASVKANFNPNNRIEDSWYKVNVEESSRNSSELVYQWYYVSPNGKEHLIDNANSNELKPNKNLFEAAYKDNTNHKVGIMCKIYKDGKLDTIVDQKTNSRFYMSVVTNNRVIRVSK